MPVPAILLRGIGARQQTAGALHRKAQSMKELAHMSGMVADTELCFDHTGNQGRGPHPAVQSIGDRPAVEEVLELFALRLTQLGWSARPIPLQETLDSVRLVAGQPLRHLGARRLENSRQLAAGPAFGIQKDGLQTLGHPVSALALRLLPQAHQTALRPGVQPQQSGNHGDSSWEEYATEAG